MPSDALTRDALVEALDDLGERKKIANVWTTETDDPYPPEAVRKRSKRLRWRLRLKRGALLVLMLLVGVTGGLGTSGWTIPGALFAFLSGFGIVAAGLSPFIDPWAENQMRALQLYDLLQQIDDPVSPTEKG